VPSVIISDPSVIRLAVRVHRRQAELVLAELLELAPSGVEEVAVSDEVVEYAVYGAPRHALPARLVLSGLLATEADDVAAAFTARGMAERARRARGEWAALELARA
jgi:hypothetical protein